MLTTFRSITAYQHARAFKKGGDPYRIRTDVKGVRGLCLNPVSYTHLDVYKRQLKESSSTLRLANILNRRVSGSAKTFNQQTNVSLDNKYIVLDISELTGDLLTVGMFIDVYKRKILGLTFHDGQ